MRPRGRVWRQPVPWCASLLLTLLALLALLQACDGPSSTTTSLTAVSTATEFATAMFTDTPIAILQPTATPTPRRVPTVTPTPRPKPTATATPTPTPQTVVITINNFAFSPASVTITAGTTVEWMNMDATTHTTTSNSADPASWDSGPLATNATFSLIFTTPGTYGYHCAIHLSMTGTITVTS